VDNPAMTNSSLGLAHMLENADAVIWLTAITLFTMSVISWTLIIAKGRSTQRLRTSVAGLASQFWAASDLKSGTAQLRAAEPVAALCVIARRRSSCSSRDRSMHWITTCVTTIVSPACCAKRSIGCAPVWSRGW